mgnify:FL=1
MSMQYRYEMKYVLSDTEALALQQQLKHLLYPDTHGKQQDGSYLIKSLYFDTIDNSAMYEKNDGVLMRRKFRIRYYDNDSSFIRLEKKMKHNNMTAKQQARITRMEYNAIVAGNYDAVGNTHPLVIEFISLCKAEHLVPSVVVEYNRLAFTYPVSDVRITFDRKIRSGMYTKDPIGNPHAMMDVLDPGLQVLEVKYNEVLPSAVAKVISGIPMRREAVSKFARCAGWK